MRRSHLLGSKNSLRDRRPLPTTNGFASLHDHARLPWRFFGRLVSSAQARLIAGR
jgi:hypothetical protein